MPKPLVLVVDDEEANRHFCSSALELNGYEVVAAPGTEEAVAVLSSREVDFIICDVSMPHNGRRVYQYLLQNFPELQDKFIFVTGNPENKTAVEPVPCLMKPFSVRVLLDLLRSALQT